MTVPVQAQRLVRAADLQPGDRTPWYEILAAPEQDGDESRVLVKHTTEHPPFTDYVRGPTDEEIPIYVNVTYPPERPAGEWIGGPYDTLAECEEWAEDFARS